MEHAQLNKLFKCMATNSLDCPFTGAQQQNPHQMFQNLLPGRYPSVKPKRGGQEILMKYLHEEFVVESLAGWSGQTGRMLGLEVKRSFLFSPPGGVQFGRRGRGFSKQNVSISWVWILGFLVAWGVSEQTNCPSCWVSGKSRAKQAQKHNPLLPPEIMFKVMF